MGNYKDQALLVTGASGHFGRIAVETLLEKGASRIVAGTRDPKKIADLAAKGVETRRLDFDDAESLVSGFAGIDRVLLISTDADGKRVQHIAAIKAAEKAGVKHIVYTSAPHPTPNEGGGILPEHFWSEAALAASGLDWTALRNHIYAEMTLMSAQGALPSGQLFDATGGKGRSFVTREDTARTAVGALLSAEGRLIHDVTGPETVTASQLAALFQEISGKSVVPVPLTLEAMHQGMLANGLPASLADTLIAFDRETAEGYHGVISDAVERFSGKRPTTLRDFLIANKAALRDRP